MTSAVLDASVLVPAPLRDTLLRAAQQGMYLPVWSREILEEVRRTLLGDFGISESRVDRLIGIIHDHFPGSVVSDYEAVVERMTNHPKDRHVLAVAVFTRCPVVVTANLRHFPAVATEPFGVAAVSPDQFLMDLNSRFPEVMRSLLEGQAADLRQPTMSVGDVLVRLRPHAPHFCEEVDRRWIDHWADSHFGGGSN